MFNVLAWNIQFFTKKRIADDSGAGSEQTVANLLYIITTVEQSGSDIFVVIEPRSSQGGVEQLATGGGADGLLYLLAQMRASMPSREWHLVPPLRLNPRDHVGKIATYTECIGVFWSNANLTFTGPLVWPDGQNNATGPPIAQGSGATAVYPAPWNQAVPINNSFAGQCRFFGDNNNEVLFPEEYNRRPFFTTFSERNAPNRTLKLFTMHTTPGLAARDGLARLLGVRERIPGNREVSLIIGDLNVNLNAWSLLEAATFQEFRERDSFAVLLPERSPSYPTRILAAPEATPALYLTQQTLDYSLVRWGPSGTHLRPSAAVVDRVAAVPAPRFSSEISPSLAEYLAMINQNERDQLFRQRRSYGHIAQPRRDVEEPDQPADGTSDHIPIMVSV